ncbi:MAG: sugar MFS transporter [Alphaproteobacteria bacterium]|nr:sugar MFS transporter [Alphaproteobacteria bacterium]
MWGFCTVLNDVLVPHLKAVFEMNYVQTMLIQFVFFGSYLVMSLPSAALIEWVGYKYAIMIGLAVMGAGCLVFIPAAGVPSYGLFLLALFILAAGITLLQVAANPYVAVLGPEKTASARLNLVQGFNSLATTVGPWFGGLLILSQTKAGQSAAGAVESLADRLADARAVQMPYLGIAAVLFLLALLIWVTRLPKFATHPRNEAEASDSLWRHKALVMGAVAIFVYVGAEVSIGSFLISYTTSPHISHMTTADAARYLSFYWGGAMVGRFVIGAFLLRFVPPSKMLADNCIAAVFLIVVSMLAHGPLAMWAILLVGMCNSIMFPTIFTLAIRGLGPLTGRGSGILVMAIFGGAVVPMLQARAADTMGLTVSFVVPMVCYAYIWLFALKTLEADQAAAKAAP